MDETRIRPDLDDLDSWAGTIRNWRDGRDRQAIMDLSGLGSPDKPISIEFLNMLADSENVIGALDCSSAHLSPVNWDRVTFIDAAVFHHAEFSGNALFRGAQFSGNALFHGAQFRRNASFRRAEFSFDAEFTTTTFGAESHFEQAQFGGDETRFDEAQFNGKAFFRQAEFTGHVGFREALFSTDADFEDAQFCAETDFCGARLATSAGFNGARFGSRVLFEELSLDGQNGPALEHDGPIELAFERATFAGIHHDLRVGVASMTADVVVNCSDARVEGELIVALGRGCVLDAPGIRIRAPMKLLALASDDSGKLRHLEGADITAPFRVGRLIDLSETIWGGHDLTAITLADTSTLPRTGFLRIVTERYGQPNWLLALGQGRRVLAADRGHLDNVALAGIEQNYRDLRRELEAIGNNHGANDFYYGEMEARRRQLRWLSPYRWLLETYRAVSGYGTRAWSAIVSWMMLTIAASALVQYNGVDLDNDRRHLDFGATWRFMVDTSLSIFRPTSAPSLSLAETVIALTVRILGPVLLALAALAIRNQTKR